MLRVRIFRQYRVELGVGQPRDKGLAARNRVIVVHRAVKNPDRAIADLGIGQVGGRAVRIEGYIARELHAGFIPEFLETIEARIERRLSAARKSHQHDAFAVDARMFGEDIEWR